MGIHDPSPVVVTDGDLAALAFKLFTRETVGRHLPVTTKLLSVSLEIYYGAWLRLWFRIRLRFWVVGHVFG